MSPKEHPNLLFIMCDQLRYDCLGANGNEIIQTPNLDRLAKQSANFHSCFCQAPVCVPSRQTFFTGRYPHSHRNRVNYTPLDSRETLIQARLSAFGYATGFVGKLHYYPATRQHALSTGFDRGLIHDGGPTDKHSDYVRWLQETRPDLAGRFRECRRPEGGNPFTSLIPQEYHETAWCGEKTRDMLREFASREKPFFIFSSFWRPHAPFEVPEPWSSLYDEVDISLPEAVSEEYVHGLPLPLQKLIMRYGKDAYHIDSGTLQWIYRSYYGAVSQIDQEVGLTLHALEELGLEDNTIVVFCSDHGDLLNQHGIMGKNAFFEGAIHIPFMIRFPETVIPGEYNDLIETTDVLSTLFELCGLEVPYENQGLSFASLITAGAKGFTYAPRELVFGENIIPEVITTENLNFVFQKGLGVAGIRHPDAKMLRSDRWKYVRYCCHGEELYDLREDPGEMCNRAGDPGCRATLMQMREALLDWLISADEADQIAPRWCDL